MNNFFERRYVVAGIFITIFLILLARLFYIQIVDDHYLIYANKQAIRKFTQIAARGPIFDRNGQRLVENELLYDINVIPKQVTPFDTVEFCKLIGMDKADFDTRFAKALKYYPYTESPFEKQLSQQLYASLQERISEFPGFSVKPNPVRTYPDSIAAQFLGYIGEVKDEDIAKSGGSYHLGDYIGITGVEKAYEPQLRGQQGVKMMMVDARNNPRGPYANGEFDTVAVAGERITSSLEINIQKLAEKLMHNKVGSVVAIEPSTGEILAFVSSPTYDPNLMVGHNRGRNYDSLRKDPYLPFFIRSIDGTGYPPGSSFKPLSALIALQEGIITPSETFHCTGAYQSGNKIVKCLEPHGTVDLAGAVEKSCNGYFTWVFDRLMDKINAKKISPTYIDWRERVTKFGLGTKLGVDMPNEKGGNIPTASFYDKKYHANGWRTSTINSIAIGQGEVSATPLQLANIECTIANHGYYYTPHLIKSVGSKTVVRPQDTVKHYVGIDGKWFEPVIDGMEAVVDHGTAAKSKIPGIRMVGKTGTAQTHGEDNSVFVAYAPRENPKIAIAVIVENAGEGAHFAAPIASFIVEKYLKGTVTAREAGTADYFMNMNRLPDINSNYSRKNKAKASITDSSKNIKKLPPLKPTSTINKKETSIKYLATK